MKNHIKQRLKNPDIGYVTIDDNGIVTSCNDLAASILGTSTEQLIQQKLVKVLTADKRFKTLADRLSIPLSSMKNEQFKLPAFHKGRKDSITIRIVKLPDGQGKTQGAYIGLIDYSGAVTTRVMALNSIAEGVFTVDQEMKITSFNEAAEQMTGWTQDEVLGRPCKTVFKANICSGSCAVSNSIMNNCNIRYDRDIYITRKDGPLFRSVSAQRRLSTRKTG